MTYPVVLEREDDGRYSVYARDLPGCTSWGNTRDEAIAHIREAVDLWIESAKADGDPIPPPGTSLEYIKIAG
jgi:predicted RNase H-like HicB family nuclease